MSEVRILTVRIKEPDDFGSIVSIEYGAKEIEKKIPNGNGLVRISAIFDESGQLSDAELITVKT